MVLLKERLEGGGDLGQRLSGRGEIASPFSEASAPRLDYRYSRPSRMACALGSVPSPTSVVKAVGARTVAEGVEIHSRATGPLKTWQIRTNIRHRKEPRVRRGSFGALSSQRPWPPAFRIRCGRTLRLPCWPGNKAARPAAPLTFRASTHNALRRLAWEGQTASKLS